MRIIGINITNMTEEIKYTHHKEYRHKTYNSDRHNHRHENKLNEFMALHLILPSLLFGF